jgi:hypothetical protein
MPRKVDDDLFIEDGTDEYQENEVLDDAKPAGGSKKKAAHSEDDEDMLAEDGALEGMDGEDSEEEGL